MTTEMIVHLTADPVLALGLLKGMTGPSVTKQDTLETKGTHPGDDSGDNGDPFRVMPQERKRVFGENILPHHLACQGFCHPQYSMPNSPVNPIGLSIHGTNM